jgi:hypothetical protein
VTTAGIPTGPGVPAWDPPATLLERVELIEAGRAWQEGGDPQSWLDTHLTTPENSMVLLSRMSDEDGGAGVDYGWIAMAAARELGNRPVTGFASRTEAQKSYGGSSVARAYGLDQEAHAHELTYGLFPSKATAVADGSDTLTNIVSTDPSSQFAPGMAIRGDGAFPVGATILAITGRRGSPTAIQVSAAVPAGSYSIRARDTAGLRESVGLLVTTNGGEAGDPDWLANPNGIGILFQSYNDYSRARNALQFGPSSVDPTGRAIRFASTVAERGISVESVAMDNFAVFSSGVFAGGVLSFSGVTAASGLSFATSGIYSIAAINLAGQNIATDTTVGMKLWTSAAQKGGFFGRTPQVRPTLGVPAATDPASTMALVNAIRAALIESGTGLGLVAA